MSLTKQVTKLKGFVPSVPLKRNESGFPCKAYFPGAWGGCSHVIYRAPMQRMPLWQKMFWGTVWCSGMFTYPLYVTYKMYDWDRLDENQ